MVHRALRVDLGLVGSGDVGELGALEDVEVVVGGVTAGVTFGADGGAEDDQVFSDTYWSGLVVVIQGRAGLVPGPWVLIHGTGPTHNNRG